MVFVWIGYLNIITCERSFLSVGYRYLHHLNHASKNIYEKKYESFDCFIQVDFDKEKIIFPEDKDMRIEDTITIDRKEIFIWNRNMKSSSIR